MNWCFFSNEFNLATGANFCSAFLLNKFLYFITNTTLESGHLGLGRPGGTPQPLSQPPGKPQESDHCGAEDAGKGGGGEIEFLKLKIKKIVCQV